jgi:hypothetical protein
MSGKQALVATLIANDSIVSKDSPSGGIQIDVVRGIIIIIITS